MGVRIPVPYFPLNESRARYLGGSTNLWGGWSRPLDDILKTAPDALQWLANYQGGASTVLRARPESL